MSINQEVQTEMRLFDLERTIEYAQVRCMTKLELIDELAKFQPGDFLDPYMLRLSELKLNKKEAGHLVTAIDSILKDYKKYPSKEKAKVESFISRLIYHLPNEYSAKYFEIFIDSTRMTGRKVAYRARLNRALSFDEFTKLLAAYNLKGELDALKAILANSQYLSLELLTNILESIEDKYWKARLIEVALGGVNNYRSRYDYGSFPR